MKARTLMIALALFALLPACAAVAAPARTSLVTVEHDVMCPTCGIPLAEAESPQANRERAFIRDLIDKGESEGQIKTALVAQFGPNVLGLPKAQGFNLAIYLIPIGLLLLALTGLAIALPRWRKKGTEAAAAESEPLSDADAARLESELGKLA